MRKTDWLKWITAFGFIMSLSAQASLQDGQPYDVQVNAQGYQIDGQYRILRGGSVQWFRIPPSEWQDRLTKFKAAGFNTVDLYVAWNVVEPSNGQFVFDQVGLGHFLDLCKSMGLYVYLRPGPYITNEMDGGGIPAWLNAISTKKSLAADGMPNYRTVDPDYLFYVGRYLHNLDSYLQNYFANRGGPIVLYALENEYNWFLPFHELDKVFWYNNGPERNVTELYNPAAYFTALKNIVLADGVSVPLTTCPGDGKASDTGDVPGITIMPNIYAGIAIANSTSPESEVTSLLADLHNPSAHGGAYVNTPSGATESDRDPVELTRLMLSGLHAGMAFNAVGMATPGYHNAVVLYTRSLSQAFDFSNINNIINGFVSPQVGYFSGVVDYDGPISASGLLRPTFYAFRRMNMFFDSVEPYLGSSGAAQTQGLSISNTALGAPEGSQLTNYWTQGQQGFSVIDLVNASGQAQTVPVGGIQLGGLSFPQYVPMTVPVATLTAQGQFSQTSNTYVMPLVQNLPLDGAATLNYTTSELLSAGDFNGDALLMVHGSAGSQGEMSISGLGQGATVLSQDPSINIVSSGMDPLVITYQHAPNVALVIQAASGQMLRVWITTSDEAGKVWRTRVNQHDVIITGLDFLNTQASLNQADIQLKAEYSGSPDNIMIVSPEPWQPSNLLMTSGWNSTTQASTYIKPTQVVGITTLPSLSSGRAASDTGEAQPGYNDANWQHWSGQPRALETLGIDAGHAWYRAELDLSHTPYFWEDCSLYVQNASDIVGIYVNGTYLSTESPLGTELQSNDWNGNYQFPSLRPYLHAGRNIIAFRTEIWGHGSFMWPRGTLMGTTMRMPALGFDSIKGLVGSAQVGGNALSLWSVAGGLGGERGGYMSPSYNDSAWSTWTLPMNLARGEVRWYRTTFNQAQLPSLQQVDAPLALHLTGTHVKATVWLNGQLIGRWVSGDGWLGRGFWGRALRDMWMSTDPDYLPLSQRSLFPAGQNNVLAIAFEDVGGGSDSGGQVGSVNLALAPEQFGSQGLVASPLGVFSLELNQP